MHKENENDMQNFIKTDHWRDTETKYTAAHFSESDNDEE
jgi:hypothetical protein